MNKNINTNNLLLLFIIIKLFIIVKKNGEKLYDYTYEIPNI